MKKTLTYSKGLLSQAGFTLFELLVVIAIIGGVFAVLIVTYRGSVLNQALTVSAETTSNTLREAYLFSREAKDEKGWGVRTRDDRTLELVSGFPDAWEVDRVQVLESGIRFADTFFITFDIGTGATSSDMALTLHAANGQSRTVVVTKSGLVEIKNE